MSPEKMERFDSALKTMLSWAVTYEHMQSLSDVYTLGSQALLELRALAAKAKDGVATQEAAHI